MSYKQKKFLSGFSSVGVPCLHPKDRPLRWRYAYRSDNCDGKDVEKLKNNETMLRILDILCTASRWFNGDHILGNICSMNSLTRFEMYRTTTIFACFSTFLLTQIRLVKKFGQIGP